MRVWADFTNTAHVLVLRPLVELLEQRGHEVVLTARPLSHTVDLLEEWGHPYTVLGRHGGAGAAGQGRGRCAPGRADGPLRSRQRRFDCALAHGSTDLPAACRLLGVPNTTMLDYEFALAPAPGQQPPRLARAGPGGDPARPAGAPRRAAAEARPLPGPEGGVLHVGLRAGHRGARGAGARSRADPRRRPHRPRLRPVSRRLGEPGPAAGPGAAEPEPRDADSGAAAGPPSRARRSPASACHG